jgi:hypothetical protein
MADPRTLLARHQPVLRYDSQEVYFADSAAEWTDDAVQLLLRADGMVIATVPPTGPLSLDFLGPSAYADGEPAREDDCISRPGRDYLAAARRLHHDTRYGNRMYGRWATGRDGRTWLQYWFWYFYNDYNLIGHFLKAGLHEGDWEMVQLRLDVDEAAPDLAVYAQHTHAAARPWQQVERDGERPVVHPARGSHASYFTAADDHWTGVWFDHADGRGASPPIALEIVEDDDDAYAWMRWPGFWGDTKPDGPNPLDSFSPRSPGHHAQWEDPHALLLTAEQHERFELPARGPAPTPPPAPHVALTRVGAVLQVAYECPGWPAGSAPAGLVATLNSPDDPLPPVAHRVEIAAPAGVANVEDAKLHDAWSYQVAISVLDSAGIASAATLTELPAA